MHQSWLTSLAEVRPAGPKGLGVYALADLPAGTTVAGFGGHVVERTEFDTLDDSLRTHALQIDEHLYLVSLPPFAPADYANHSCDPNCGIVGSCVLVTMRAVAAGEELCFDYAMTDTNDYDEFVCECSTAGCRRLITGGDWELPELQDRYAGYFSAYISHRILHAAAADDR